MKILKPARLVLAGAGLAALAGPAAVAAPATALAQPVVSAHHTARPDAVDCAGGKAVRSATLTPGDYGEVVLCYNSITRTVWAKMATSNLSICYGGTEPGPGCGGATVANNDGAESQSCSIAVGSTGCATHQINDAGITSYAAASVIYAVKGCGAGDCYAHGTTGSY